MFVFVLFEEYGLFGVNGVFFVNFFVFFKELYILFVDICISFICEYFLISFNKVIVLIIFVL